MSKQSISFIVTNSGTITAVIGAKNYSVPKDHRHYEEIKKAMVDGDSVTFEKLANASEGIRKFAKGKVTVADGVVFYNGEPIHNSLTERVIRLMAEGFPFEPMLLFLENLMMNPSKRSVNQLFDFLSHKNLPLTSDGHFLAYKSVRGDWLDHHSGTVPNTIGSVIEMERNRVDDDPDSHCSSGYHAGSMDYVRGFGGGDRRILIVKINPRDAVSVPNDHNCTKLRCCRYEVLSEYTGDLTAPVYNETGSAVAEFDDDDDDYDSELEYDNENFDDEENDDEE